MGQMITCTSVGAYGHALTRGKQYELLAHDEAKGQIRLRGDNNRTRWYGSYGFDFEGGTVVSLTSWEFDDPVINEYSQYDETNNYVDVVIQFNDGTQRWCTLMTPDCLKRMLQPRSDPAQWGGAYEPALWSRNTIFIRNLKQETVDWTLRYIDSQDELLLHTQPLDNDTADDDEENELPE